MFSTEINAQIRARNANRNFGAERLYRDYMDATVSAAYWRGYTGERAAELEAFYQSRADVFWEDYCAAKAQK